MLFAMRTTLNIDDDVLRAVKELAKLRSDTAGQVLSDLARETLERDRAPQAIGIRNGIPLLPDRPDAGVVTPDVVRKLQDTD